MALMGFPGDGCLHIHEAYARPAWLEAARHVLDARGFGMGDRLEQDAFGRFLHQKFGAGPPLMSATDAAGQHDLALAGQARGFTVRWHDGFQR
jgi:hypothetical protein